MSAARVLYVIAHPDDEDPYTLTYLARARGCHVALFSLTRGEGGMNALGDEAEEALGFLRTHELLAAARRYGVAEVLLASAFDYGYSRRLEEAAARWDEEVLIAEAVEAIRRVRADVVVSRFAEEDDREHAHHRFAARVARRAASAAGLPALFGGEQSTSDVPPHIRAAAEDGYLCHRSQVPGRLLVGRDRPVVYRDAAGAGRILDGITSVAATATAADTAAAAPADTAAAAPAAAAARLPCSRADPADAMVLWRRPSWRLRPLVDQPAPAVLVDAAPRVLWVPPGGVATLRIAARGRPRQTIDLRVRAGGLVAPERAPVSLHGDGDGDGRGEAAIDLSAPPGAATRGVVTLWLPDGSPALRLRSMPAPIPPMLEEVRAAFFTHPVAVAPAGPVGYIPGTGDGVPAALALLGVEVRELSAPIALDRLATLIIGLRAYEVTPALRDAAGAIAAFCRAGGHAVVLAQTPPFDPAIDAPLPGELPLEAEEACEEDAPAELAPGDPLTERPNRLGPADLEGWIEQRGSRFWSRWDGGLAPLVELGDPGRPRQRGAWLSGRVGRGRYTYCALALHRQLPHAVPGAYRILANLVSAAPPR
ncbi:MAG TPA: PIG-L family deacetylase [Kofleriaceae bacterium]|nr:PIG-L family deacetylase [Kofleriaceae bacterium]